MSVSAFEHWSSQNGKKLHPVETSKDNNVQTNPEVPNCQIRKKPQNLVVKW